MGTDALKNGGLEIAQVPQFFGRTGQGFELRSALGQVKSNLAGEAQHLENVVKGRGKEQAAGNFGLGEPGGQVRKINEGDIPLTAFQVLEFLNFCKFYVNIGEILQGTKPGHKGPTQMGGGIGLDKAQKSREF